jgi:hypothetical protein
MKTDFSIISDFLDRCGPEVCGHSAAPPAPEFTAKLDRFARGDCDPTDRAAMCDLLRTKPEYLRALARRVKELREEPSFDPSAGVGA